MTATPPDRPDRDSGIGCNNRTMPEAVSTIDELAVVTAFNDAINARDLDRLGSLMTDAHRFVDSVGATVDGKDACLDAWRASSPPSRTTETSSRSVAAWARAQCSSAGVPCAVSLSLMDPPSGRVVVRDARRRPMAGFRTERDSLQSNPACTRRPLSTGSLLDDEREGVTHGGRRGAVCDLEERGAPG